MNTDFMSQTEKDVLTLIRYAYKGEKMPKGLAKDFNWREIIDELLKQAVVSVPIDIVNEEEVPGELFEEWVEYSVNTMMQHEIIGMAHDELIALADKNNIPIVILKGLGAARDYPNPLYRAVGDIDVLVKPKDFEAMLELMCKNGYELHEERNFSDYHETLYKDDLCYELHREPSGIGSGEKSTELKMLFENAVDRAVSEYENGHEIRMFEPFEHSLVLLLHIIHHLNGGLGIRQVCDWVSCVNANIDDQAWENEYKARYEALGVANTAKAFTKLAKMYLGIGENLHWCDDADENLCVNLMKFVIQHGNFGNKDMDTKESTKFMENMESDKNVGFIRGLRKRLQVIGEREWKLLKKHERLRAFAWIYAIFRYIRMLMTGERDMAYINKMKKSIDQKKELQNQLKIFK